MDDVHSKVFSYGLDTAVAGLPPLIKVAWGKVPVYPDKTMKLDDLQLKKNDNIKVNWNIPLWCVKEGNEFTVEENREFVSILKYHPLWETLFILYLGFMWTKINYI